MELKAMTLHKRNRLRRGLTQLDLHVNYAREEQFKLRLAYKTYGRRLKVLGLSLFTKYHRLCNVQLELSIKVQEFTGNTQQTFRLRHGFRGLKDNWDTVRWLRYEAEACAEFRGRHDFLRLVQGCLREQHQAYAEARDWHLLRLTKTAFKAIADFKYVKEVTRQRLEDAREAYQFDVLMPRVFRAWKVFTVRRLRQSKQRGKADAVYEGRLADKMFRVWLGQFRDLQEEQEAGRQADSLVVRRLGTLVLRQWLQFTDLKKLARIATLHCSDRLVLRSFSAWRSQVDTKRRLLRLQLHTHEHLDRLKLKRGFRKLHALITEVQQARRRLALAHRHRVRKLKCLVFDSYGKYVANNWDSISKVRAVKQISKQLTSTRVMRGFTQTLSRRKRVEGIEKKIEWRRKDRLVGKAFSDWRGLYDQHYQERLEEADRLTHAQTVLERTRARGVLGRLSDYRKTRYVKRLRAQQAEALYSTAVKRTAWSHLRLWVHRRRQKTSQLSRSAVHYARGLKAFALSKLVEFLRDRQAKHFIYISALKTWSRQLYLKSWRGWTQYTHRKHAKAQAEAQAMQLRKRDMLKDVVSCWVRAGLQWRSLRDTAAKEVVLQNEEKKLALARKYGSKWLAATIRKRARSPLRQNKTAVLRKLSPSVVPRSPPRPLVEDLPRRSPVRPAADPEVRSAARKRTAPRPLESGGVPAPSASSFNLPQLASYKPAQTVPVQRLIQFGTSASVSSTYSPSQRVQEIETLLLDFKFDRDKLEHFKAQLANDPLNEPLQAQTQQLREKLQRAMPSIRLLHDEIQSLKQVY
jgi:hypothetical protein